MAKAVDRDPRHVAREADLARQQDVRDALAAFTRDNSAAAAKEVADRAKRERGE
jgi:hypothetical protein